MTQSDIWMQLRRLLIKEMKTSWAKQIKHNIPKEIELEVLFKKRTLKLLLSKLRKKRKMIVLIIDPPILIKLKSNFNNFQSNQLLL
jgi:hypothetical protein